MTQVPSSLGPLKQKHANTNHDKQPEITTTVQTQHWSCYFNPCGITSSSVATTALPSANWLTLPHQLHRLLVRALVQTPQ